uniref:Uncharacterized protein n=1 Tax=Setaria viridis TaxID=4556 RepID=A0A4U6VT54_SETVI|nr:hypothetical protein SEVIR_2G079366v2 [Setaria viridis]
MASTVVSCGEEGDGRQGCVLLQLLVVEDAADPRRKQRVRRRGVCAGGEVGARVRAPEEAGSLVVGPRRLLGGLERAQPHPDLLGGVLDLSHPPPGGPLPDAHELAAAATAFGSHFGLGFLCDWQLVAALLLGMALWLLLELELHWEEEIEGNVSLQALDTCWFHEYCMRSTDILHATLSSPREPGQVMVARPFATWRRHGMVLLRRDDMGACHRVNKKDIAVRDGRDFVECC